MNKAINYVRLIRYKILNDEMTRIEAIVLFCLMIGSILMILHITGAK